MRPLNEEEAMVALAAADTAGESVTAQDSGGGEEGWDMDGAPDGCATIDRY